MNKINSTILRCLPFLFWIGVILTTILGLIPGTSVPPAFQFWDKAQHSLAFAILAITGLLAFPKKMALVCLGLIAHGALIEVMQSTLTTTRYGDVMDWLADGTGVLIGLVVYASLTLMRPQNA